jgi:hypothetical protein
MPSSRRTRRAHGPASGRRRRHVVAAAARAGKDHPLHLGVQNAIGNQLPHCAIDELTNFPRFTHFHLVRLHENTNHVPELMAVEVVSKHIEQYPAQRNPSGVDQASN